MLQRPHAKEDILNWIKSEKYENLFMFSCCYHFAMVLHEEYGLALRGLRRHSGAIDHVWGVLGDKAVDFYGVRSESEVVRGYVSHIREPLEIVYLGAPDVSGMISRQTQMDMQMRNDVVSAARRILRDEDRFKPVRMTKRNV